MTDSTDDDQESKKAELDELISQAEDLISRLESATSGLEGSAQTAQERANEANTSAQQSEQAKISAQAAKDEVDSLKQAATENGAVIKTLSDQSTKIRQTLDTQKSELESITGNANELRDTIENLLPGATSAGLASAFRERKESFVVPKRVWGVVFVLAILSFISVAYFDPMSLEQETVSYKTIIPYVLERLPFIIPIVWLAIYAGRRHSQALRLEEDYAHKEVLSKSFEGYKQQLLEIESDLESKEKTLSLIDRTLAALALHPGRIYQGKHEDITPWDSLTGWVSKGGSAEDQSKKVD